MVPLLLLYYYYTVLRKTEYIIHNTMSFRSGSWSMSSEILGSKNTVLRFFRSEKFIKLYA